MTDSCRRDIEIYDFQEFKNEFPEVYLIARSEAEQINIDLDDLEFMQFEGEDPIYSVAFVDYDTEECFGIEFNRVGSEWNIVNIEFEAD